MPEAEDVITDVARHATIYARDLWRRHRQSDGVEQVITLRDLAQRLDFLVAAAFGSHYTIRIAQPSAPITFLSKVFHHREGPRATSAIPATDGTHIWLPAQLPAADSVTMLAWFRVLALQQAMRAERQSAFFLAQAGSPLESAVYTILEAQAADGELARRLPGTVPTLLALRAHARQARPPLNAFPPHRRPLEEFVRHLLNADPVKVEPDAPADSLRSARALAAEWARHAPPTGRRREFLFKDLWTGELRPPAAPAALTMDEPDEAHDRQAGAPRSARLSRRPDVRESQDDEDDKKQGAWMIQTSQPHEQVEDPIGMQRPTDRDESSAAEEFADALSELPEARLVSTPGRPKEVLLSDEAPDARAKQKASASVAAGAHFRYPEWDYHAGAYRENGATVHVLVPQEGPQEWVDRTLAEHRSMADGVRRRFEMLRAQRMRLRKQLDGEEADLDACIDNYADFRAGLPMAQALYQTYRRARRDMAILLLIDVSGSTDGWISASKRIIDIERDALLLVSIALEGMAEPYSIMAFSGEGPHGVTVRAVKSFEESPGNLIARRIAALEPEHYTRAGAALRHASAVLMRQPASYRLLLVLSDGKPNDIDEYEGRYGVEDMRQAITEAKLQGIHPFCMTIDRQAAGYLPAIFGAGQYALLPRSELLPVVLLEWMKRLVAR